jgi:hypothetical protein
MQTIWQQPKAVMRWEFPSTFWREREGGTEKGGKRAREQWITKEGQEVIREKADKQHWWKEKTTHTHTSESIHSPGINLIWLDMISHTNLKHNVTTCTYMTLVCFTACFQFKLNWKSGPEEGLSQSSNRFVRLRNTPVTQKDYTQYTQPWCKSVLIDLPSKTQSWNIKQLLCMCL